MRGDYFCQHIAVRPEGRLAPGEAWRTSRAELEARASAAGQIIVGPKESTPLMPHARGFASVIQQGLAVRADLTTWEPNYGRKAEAQVRWEASHGRPLGDA
jgi:tRNA threonylcarbamoyladenosine biosynthesis protein TsaB